MIRDLRKWTIRKAVPDDHSALTALAHRAKANWGYPASWIAEWKPALTISPEYIAQHCVEVAVDSRGQVVGMCSLENRGDHCELEHLWIEPDAQGHGIGSALVRRALSMALQLRQPVRLVADPFATGFYQRLGAKVIGTRPAPMAGDEQRALPILQFDVVAPVVFG